MPFLYALFRVSSVIKGLLMNGILVKLGWIYALFLFCSNYAAFGQIGLSLVEFPSVLKGLLMNAILVMLGLIYALFSVSSVFKAGLDFGEKIWGGAEI